MRSFPSLLLATAFLAIATTSLPLHADEGTTHRPAGDAVATRPAPPPPGVHFLPPHLMKKLNLTADQKKQIHDLEKEIKAKLDKILTPEQKKIMEESRPPRREGQGPDGDAPRDAGPHESGGDNGPPR